MIDDKTYAGSRHIYFLVPYQLDWSWAHRQISMQGVVVLIWVEK